MLGRRPRRSWGVRLLDVSVSSWKVADTVGMKWRGLSDS